MKMNQLERTSTVLLTLLYQVRSTLGDEETDTLIRILTEDDPNARALLAHRGG